MEENIPQSARPICAHLAGIEVVGNLKKNSSTTRPDHYVVAYVDDDKFVQSEKRPRLPAPQWRWPEDQQFWFHPSSRIKIIIYRESSLRASIAKHLVGQYTGQIIELLETNALIDLEDKTGAGITSKLKIKLSLVSESKAAFMEAVSADVAHLDSNTEAHPGILALRSTLQLTKKILDVFADTHPILKASWIVVSAVYKAVQETRHLDDTVRDLAENLREVLGAATKCADLLVIDNTTNVIDEIGRTSLKVASLIHEYTRHSFAVVGRTFNTQLSSNMKSRIEKYQTSCKNLKEQFDRRIGIDTNQGIKEIVNKLDENDMNNQNTLKIIKDTQLVEKIDKWLSAPDSSRNYNAALELHQKNTCSWFLEGPRFRELQSEKADFLWIKGTAGCGKTILCSSIIHKIIELQENNASVKYAYFFFDGRDSQNDLQLHDKLIRSLIWQLALQCDDIPAALVELYGRGHQQPSTSLLEGTLHRIINDLSSTYLVIDSLDECAERGKTLRWIKQIIKGNLRMVVASRPERDIEDVLQQLDPHYVDLVNESANRDITTYLDQELQLVTKWDKEMQDMIKSRLIERAEGMFRWVALQLIALKKCSNRQSVKSQLDTLPNGLNDTYDQILSKISNQNERSHTQAFLRWLCFSARPMTLVEIAETVVVDLNAEGGPQYTPERQYFDKRDVMEKCAGLITETNEGNVKLAHFSLKEYLLSEHLHIGAASWFHLSSAEHSHSLIAQTCLAYLLHFDRPDLVDEHVAGSFPLAPYAAEHWIFHAQSGGIDEPEPSDGFVTLTLAKKLFTAKEDACFSNWVQIWDFDNQDTPMQDRKKYKVDIGLPLYYAALAGLENLLLHVIEDGDVNEQGGKYGNALQAASAGGYKEIVKLLLKNGADVNVEGGKYYDALHAASTGGHDGIVKLLLENGADVTVEGGEHGNALQLASAGGHDGIVKLLLENGANVNASGGRYSDALQAASVGGYEGIVKLLLDNGADVNVQGGWYGNALQAASAGGYKEIVKLLLENGADVNVQGGYSNAFQVLSAGGHEVIVKLLLENGVDVNEQGGLHGNALQAASAGGHDGIVKLLLENGAEVNVEGGLYGNALQAASARGHEGMVKLLLENGANVNIRGGEYGTALQVASARGHEGMVKLLLENGADVNVQGGLYGNALQGASARGYEGIAKLLFEHGANPKCTRRQV